MRQRRYRARKQAGVETVRVELPTPVVALYDLRIPETAQDPHAALVKTPDPRHQQIARRLFDAFERYVETGEERQAVLSERRADTSPEAIEELRALGYVR